MLSLLYSVVDSGALLTWANPNVAIFFSLEQGMSDKVECLKVIIVIRLFTMPTPFVCSNFVNANGT